MTEKKLLDKDIREPLFDYLEGVFGKIRILEEKWTGRSRADVIMVTERALCGIEIKSDADTYTRLATQVRDYDRYFDYNIVAVGSSHAMHIEEHVPEYWGIITIEAAENEPGDGSPAHFAGEKRAGEPSPGSSGSKPVVDFYMLRKPQKNPNVLLENKLSMLWRPELARIQERNMMPRYPGYSKANVRKKILEMVPEEILHKEISDTLFERDYTKIHDEINAYRVSKGLKKRRRRRKKGHL